MKFIDKLKDLFTDEEEEFETKEIEVGEEKEEPNKLPTFMRNKIEEEEANKEKKVINEESHVIDKEVVKTRSNSFAFPIDMEEDYEVVYTPRNRNVLEERQESKPKSTVADLYTKKEEQMPKKFKPTPVISPVYGVLDKNYTKDEVKIQDESKYEIPRASRKIDFETVRNKAYGTLTDEIRNNLCENCELYKEVKIIKKNGEKVIDDDINLLEDIVEGPKKDVTIEEAAENYYDFGVDYEPVKETPAVINAEKVEIEVNNDIKIVNHNDEESSAEKIEVKEEPIELPEEIIEEKEPPKRKRKTVKEEKEEDKLLEDTKEFEEASGVKIEDATKFHSSPIISPIYGIENSDDKNSDCYQVLNGIVSIVPLGKTCFSKDLFTLLKQKVHENK